MRTPLLKKTATTNEMDVVLPHPHKYNNFFLSYFLWYYGKKVDVDRSQTINNILGNILSLFQKLFSRFKKNNSKIIFEVLN